MNFTGLTDDLHRPGRPCGLPLRPQHRRRCCRWANRHVVAPQLPDGARESIDDLALPAQAQFFAAGRTADLSLPPGEVGTNEQHHAAETLEQGCADGIPCLSQLRRVTPAWFMSLAAKYPGNTATQQNKSPAASTIKTIQGRSPRTRTWPPVLDAEPESSMPHFFQVATLGSLRRLLPAQKSRGLLSAGAARRLDFCV